MEIFKPNDDLFFWGPIPGRPIYVSYFMESIAKRTHVYYEYKWPDFLFYFIGDKMTFVTEDKKLKTQGEKYFNRWIMDDHNFLLVKQRYEKSLAKLKTIEEKIKNLNKLDHDGLRNLYSEFHEIYLSFWDHGLVPEIANWGGEVVLREKLFQIPEQDFLPVYEGLSAPTGLSFYQKEHLDLLRVKKGQQTVFEHQRRYFWINNSYRDIYVLDEDFFKQRLGELADNDEDKEVSKILELPDKIARQRDEIISKYQLSPEIKKISERLGDCIYWQDDRKGNIFIANYYISLFLREFARRFSLSFSRLEQYWCWELPALFNGLFVPEHDMEQRLMRQAGHMSAENNCNTVLIKEKFDEYINPILSYHNNYAVDRVSGLSASIGKGLASGPVKILLDPRRLEPRPDGDILIAPMTSPEYIVAMRKAGAVVTDAGGMTCHAAIVSRELGIPCVVGTKIATKVFQDGDYVEVDANHGTVVRKST